MAKTYLNTVKYEIKAKYEVEGIVEKPDIIGAIFGQSEGLLGEDMDLKELQQAGKLGRIEITVNKGKGKTTGEITLPSSLDQVKTSILAAAIETVEKVGPCDTKVTIISISDVRKEKRTQITDRAKQLLQKMQKFESVESSELATEIKEGVRTQKLVNLNGLEAGPEVEDSDLIIVVEGRADVLKLLGYGINNAVAMNGSNIDQALVKLCNEKRVIVLIDGDRGGDMNVKKLASMANVNFVAKAPDGKEVEELTQKEILQALKRRVSFKDYEAGSSGFERNDNGFRPQFQNRNFTGQRNNFGNNNFRNNNYRNNDFRNNSFRPREGQGNYNNFRQHGDNNFRPRDGGNFRPHNGSGFRPREDRGFRPRFDPFQGNYRAPKSAVAEIPKEIVTEKPVVEKTISKKNNISSNIEKDYSKIKGSLKARLYDNKGKKIKDVPVKELVENLDKSKKKIDTILFDGIITKRLVDAAEKNNVINIVGAKKGTAKSDTVNILSM